VTTTSILNTCENPKSSYNAKLWNNLGCSYTTIEEFDNAINCFNTAIECDPDKYWSWNNLGLVYKRHGKLDDAIKCLKKATELKQESPIPWSILGLCYKEKGDIDEALKCLETALDVNSVPWYCDDLYTSDSTYGGWSEKEITSCLESLVEHNQDDHSAYYKLGVMYNESKADEAIKCFKKGLELHSDKKPSSIIWKYLGESYQKQGQLEESINCFKKAIKTEPDNFYVSEIWLHLGLAYEENDNIDEAIKCLKKITEKNSRCGEVWYHLGMLEERKRGALAQSGEKV